MCNFGRRFSMRNLIGLCLMWCAVAACGGEGGAIKGVVVYDGDVPESPPWDVPVARQSDCKCKTIENEALVVDKATKGIKYAIVRLMIEPGDAAPKPAQIAQVELKNCKFIPHAVISAPGENVQFVNG